MELSSVGTLSTPTLDGWPLGFGVRFAVDPHGTPVLFLNDATSKLSVNCKSSIHVQVCTDVYLKHYYACVKSYRLDFLMMEKFELDIS